MSIEHRVNKKTGQAQFKCRYRWRDENGKLRSSDTGWFDSVKEAEKQASQLKEAKEKDSSLKITAKREATIGVVFRKFMEDLQNTFNNLTLENNTSAFNNIHRAQTIYKSYMPDEIKYTKVNEITPRTFRMWIEHINNTKLSGATVKNYVGFLYEFNKWLANKGYYTDSSLDLNIQLAMKRTTVKNKKTGARKDRHLMGMDDIETITSYWEDKGLGKFFNFYHYTLFYVLAYTGMRSEECRGLQWKNVDLAEDERIIYIENAVPDHEKDEHAVARLKADALYTKNELSIRGIPIFDIIYQLLVDYKESYHYESKLSYEEMEECFVFPRINHNHTFNWQLFAGRGIYLKYYKQTIRDLGLPNSDVGMLRHCCASFLVAPEPDGLGMDANQVKDFFGHVNQSMLNEVYAKLEQQQKTMKMKKTFAGYYTPKENKKDKAIITARQRMIERVKGDNDTDALEARTQRILQQVVLAYADERKEYYYSAKDEEIIKSIAEWMPSIKFIKED